MHKLWFIHTLEEKNIIVVKKNKDISYELRGKNTKYKIVYIVGYFLGIK